MRSQRLRHRHDPVCNRLLHRMGWGRKMLKEPLYRIFPALETCCLFTAVWMQRSDSVLIFHIIPFWLLGEFRGFEGTVANIANTWNHVASLLRVACWWFAHQLGPPGYMPCNIDRFATIGFWLWLMRQSDGVRAGLFCPLKQKDAKSDQKFYIVSLQWIYYRQGRQKRLVWRKTCLTGSS